MSVNFNNPVKRTVSLGWQIVAIASLLAIMALATACLYYQSL